MLYDGCFSCHNFYEGAPLLCVLCLRFVLVCLWRCVRWLFGKIYASVLMYGSLDVNNCSTVVLPQAQTKRSVVRVCLSCLVDRDFCSGQSSHSFHITHSSSWEKCNPCRGWVRLRSIESVFMFFEHITILVLKAASVGYPNILFIIRPEAGTGCYGISSQYWVNPLSIHGNKFYVTAENQTWDLPRPEWLRHGSWFHSL